MTDRTYAHRFETTREVDASPEQLFAAMDDHERLSAHMMASSAMMAGSAMTIELDEAKGRAVGAKIRMSGRIFGLDLELEEVVVERAPPKRKAWETLGEPRLLVVGDYRMGFEIAPRGEFSRLTMFIEYDEPPQPWTMVGRFLGPVYARWCTVSMADGMTQEFAAAAGSSRGGSAP